MSPFDRQLDGPAAPPTEGSDRPAAPVASRATFSEVYAQNYAVLHGYLRARVLDRNDADDLCQEVFLRAFAGLERFDTNQPIRPWLLGIGRNVLREHIRNVGRRKEVGWAELCLELEEIMGQDSPYADALDLLPVCMSQLGDAANQALHWHYMQGLKLEEIGNRLGRTLGATKVLMVRSRQALKRCFQAHLGRETP